MLSQIRRAFFIPIVLSLLTTACLSAGAAITLTGDLDSDFLVLPGGTPKPGVLIRQAANLVPPYDPSSPPLEPIRPDGTQMIQTGSTIPTGFHVRLIAVSYDCAADTLYIGLDVSNDTLDPVGVATGEISRAWDADGDGDPCTVCNSQLVNPVPNCPTVQGNLDPQLNGNGNDDVPSSNLAPLAEKYQIFLDLNRDGITDAVLLCYNSGVPGDSDPGHHDFAGPCGSVVHTQLSVAGVPLVINPANNPVVDVNVVYVANPADPRRDIEFSLRGTRNIPLSTGGLPTTSVPYCDINLKTFTDSDYDASKEASLNWGRFNFTPDGRLGVSCGKLANKSQLCTLPDTVTYTLSATNTGAGLNEDITISDPSLPGGVWTFTNVAPGQTVTVDPAPTKTFGEEFCGGDPFINTMTVMAVPSNCCATGTVTSACQATVSMPTRANVSVSCNKSVDKTSLCSLPDTVTYTLSAKNTSETNTPVSITIVDSQLGINQTFTGVAQGETKTITVRKTFDETFCGADPFVNTMNVTAVADDRCLCGNTSATCAATATVTLPKSVNVLVSCTKSVDKPNLCELPDMATYTLSATNISTTDAPVTIRIVDAQLGVDQTFSGVAQGATKTITVQKTFGAEFIGADPFVNTMNVTAVAEGTCICGNTSATCASSATVNLPKSVNVNVSCNKSVDKPTLCELPGTVTYTLSARNTSVTNTPVTIRIVDSLLGIDQTFAGVAQGETKTIIVQKTFDESFAGADPFVNTMSVTASAESTCVVGTRSATTSCDATVAFSKKAEVDVSCRKQVDISTITTFPTTVTYTLSATNDSSTPDTPISIRIVDTALGVDETFHNVLNGQTVVVTPAPTKTFDETFCGAEPFVNTMQVYGVAEERCVTGTVTATSVCRATVGFPKKVDVDINCTMLANGTSTYQVTNLPVTVTYTMDVTNTGSSPANITIDGTTYECVEPGEKVTFTKEVTYDETYCGHDDITTTLFAEANVGSCVEGPLCGDMTDRTSCSAVVKFPPKKTSSFTCDKKVNGVKEVTLTASDLPKKLTYVLKACNTGQTNLDFTMEDNGTMPAGTVCSKTFPAVFTNVPPGECREVTCEVTVTLSMINGVTTWEDTLKVTGVPSSDQPCAGAPDPSTCESKVTVKVIPGATRTPGFWQTHPYLLKTQISRCGPWSFGCATASNVNDALALMRDSIPSLRNGKKRSALGHARMQLAQQLVAAYANKCAFGTNPPVALSVVASAMGGTDISKILYYVGVIDGWNNSGDDVEFPVGVKPGSADPDTAQSWANQSNITQGNCFK